MGRSDTSIILTKSVSIITEIVPITPEPGASSGVARTYGALLANAGIKINKLLYMKQ